MKRKEEKVLNLDIIIDLGNMLFINKNVFFNKVKILNEFEIYKQIVGIGL